MSVLSCPVPSCPVPEVEFVNAVTASGSVKWTRFWGKNHLFSDSKLLKTDSDNHKHIEDRQKSPFSKKLKSSTSPFHPLPSSLLSQRRRYYFAINSLWTRSLSIRWGGGEKERKGKKIAEVLLLYHQLTQRMRRRKKRMTKCNAYKV